MTRKHVPQYIISALKMGLLYHHRFESIVLLDCKRPAKTASHEAEIAIEMAPVPGWATNQPSVSAEKTRLDNSTREKQDQ